MGFIDEYFSFLYIRIMEYTKLALKTYQKPYAWLVQHYTN